MNVRCQGIRTLGTGPVSRLVEMQGWDAVLVFSGTLYILVELSPPVEWSLFAPILQGILEMQRLELPGVSQSLTWFPSVPCLLS